MINLLPPDTQKGYTYARRSTHLVRLSFVLFLALVGVWLIVGFGLFYLNNSVNDYKEQTTKARQQLQDQKLDETQAQVKEISGNLKLVVQVLSREVLFSELIKQIGATIPTNAVLTNLKISDTKGGIDISAEAVDFKTASQVQVNLADPNNKIFDKADIQNISCSGNSKNPKYPCSVTIRAQFADKNPFLFINSGTGSN